MNLKIFFSISLIIISSYCFGHSRDSVSFNVEGDTTTLVISETEYVHTSPVYPGGTAAFSDDFIAATKMHKINDNISGKVIIRFVVNEKGKVKDSQIVQKGDKRINKKLQKAAKRLKKFRPATVNGVPVSYVIYFPLKYNITYSK